MISQKMAELSVKNIHLKLLLIFCCLIISASAEMTVQGEFPQGALGYSLIDAGDFNGDGFHDLAAAQPFWNENRGRVLIFFGGENPDTTADVIVEGDYNGAFFGISMDAQPDFEGDFSALLIGSPGYNNWQGQISIFVGSENPDDVADVIIRGEAGSGFGKTVVFIRHPQKLFAVTSPFIGKISIWSIQDSEAEFKTEIISLENSYYGSEGLGNSLNGNSDIDDDGICDLIAGAPFYRNGTGRVLIFRSTENSVDTSVYQEITGSGEYDYFGYSLAGGDINYDERDDFVVGAWGGGNSESGQVSVYLGNDDFPVTPDKVITGTNMDDCFAYALAVVNRAGFPSDFICGAPGYSREAENAGWAGYYFGGQTLSSDPGNIAQGEAAGGQLGFSVAGIPDWNTDSAVFWSAAAPFDSSNAVNSGKFNIYRGEMLKLFALGLSENFNLISFPVLPAEVTIAELLSGLGEKWEALYSFQNNGWQQARRSVPQNFWTLKEISVQRGYWLKMNQPDTLRIFGLEGDKHIALTSGWNLIGYPKLNSEPSWNLLNTLTNWENAFHFIPPGQWITAASEADTAFWTMKTMQAGKGYWLSADADTLKFDRLDNQQLNIKNKMLTSDRNQMQMKEKRSEKMKSINPEKLSHLDNSVAFPVLPSGFFGQVLIEGSPAPAGVEIIPVCGEFVFRSFFTDEDGKYGIVSLNGDDPLTSEIEGGTSSGEISFILSGGGAASETARWYSGTNQELGLSFNSALGIENAGSEVKIEITVDGNPEFVNGDFVSANSAFTIEIAENYKRFRSSEMQVLFDGEPIPESEIIKRSDNPPIYSVTPALLPGEHRLMVTGRDIENNEAGSEIIFIVEERLIIKNVVNFPNPFRNKTEFTYIASRSADIEIRIYSVAGKEVNKLFGSVCAGFNRMEWNGMAEDGTSLPNGVYFYKVTIRDGKETAEKIQRLVKIK